MYLQMNEESSGGSNDESGGALKQTIDAATALTKAVPIYEDALQPLAQEVGKALGTVGKAVNVALAPVSLTVWGYDQVKEFLEKRVTEKLEYVPQERIITPQLNVAGPAIEALKFTAEEETLQEMFANLIANSLDSKTAIEAHPSFVDIIKNLSSDEGLILKLFSHPMNQYPVIDVQLKKKGGREYNTIIKNYSSLAIKASCKHPQLAPNYLDNLCRLGLLDIPSGVKLNRPELYDQLEKTPIIELIKKQHEASTNHTIECKQRMVEVTSIGSQFINSCVRDKKKNPV